MLATKDSKNIIIFIAIGVAIYFLFFRKTETFIGSNPANQCKMLKERQQEVKSVANQKCVIDDPSSRGNINQRSECYNLVGNDIVSDMDTNSWCQLDASDMAIIDAATMNMEEHATAPFDGNDFAQF